MPKRKADAAAPPPAAKKKGGAGRGQGRKPNAVNTPGIDDPHGVKRKQASLADLLGVRFAKKAKAVVAVDELGHLLSING